ncbi:Carboxylesterase patB [Fusarium oxysporum f. sp. albedinis]|nr:Carboxylesterase patB [Fusarium oxysporum f. sp. albedinis]
MYKVDRSTLGNRKNGMQARCDTIPKSRKLSDLEEEIIVQFILDLDSRGFPSRMRFVEEIANSLLADRDASPSSRRVYFADMTIREPNAKIRLLFVAGLGMYRTQLQSMVQKGKEDRNRDPAIYHRAGQYHLANWYRECDLPGNWVIATSQNGWTNNQLGLEWLKRFDRSTAKRSNSRYHLLILDGHESHHSADFERYCKENKIITLCMPAHASHLLQPLDVGCFGLLKKAYGREIEHLIRCSITHISKTEFFPAFYAAFKATFTESNIQGGFRGAGLAPLDPETVISKLDVQLRTPTPPGEAGQPSTPWVSKTPKSAIEAQSQSEYLERRIRRHKSSSPESIIEALKSNTKAIKAVMHEVVLLRSELRNLREANEILSRRRRAKRTRVQKRGVMTVQEASQVIDQMDVDMQVVAELSRSGRQGRSARPGNRRCGVCGKAGHNARTCQVVIETSGEEYSE